MNVPEEDAVILARYHLIIGLSRLDSNQNVCNEITGRLVNCAGRLEVFGTLSIIAEEIKNRNLLVVNGEEVIKKTRELLKEIKEEGEASQSLKKMGSNTVDDCWKNFKRKKFKK